MPLNEVCLELRGARGQRRMTRTPALMSTWALHYGRGHANVLISLQPDATVASVTILLCLYLRRKVAAHKDTKAWAPFPSLLYAERR